MRATDIQKFLVERLKRYIRSTSLPNVKRVRPLSRAQLLPLKEAAKASRAAVRKVKKEAKEAAEREREAARA